MLDRRTRILDAALAIVGEGGTRALTHRGVDRRLNLPDGSTSNYFRTRMALLENAATRLLEVDQATLTDIHSGFDTLDDAALARGIAEFTVRLCRPGRITRTRARFALTLVHPARMESTHEQWLKLGIDNLREHGHPHPEAATRALLAYSDGVMLQAIVDSRGEGVELDREELAATVLTLIRGV